MSPGEGGAASGQPVIMNLTAPQQAKIAPPPAKVERVSDPKVERVADLAVAAPHALVARRDLSSEEDRLRRASASLRLAGASMMVFGLSWLTLADVLYRVGVLSFTRETCLTIAVLFCTAGAVALLSSVLPTDDRAVKRLVRFFSVAAFVICLLTVSQAVKAWSPAGHAACVATGAGDRFCAWRGPRWVAAALVALAACARARHLLALPALEGLEGCLLYTSPSPRD